MFVCLLQMPKPGSSKQPTYEELLQENEAQKRKNAELENQIQAKKPKIFQDFKMENETFQESAYRRLSFRAKKGTTNNDTIKTIEKICLEIIDYIPENVSELLQNLRGIDWPEKGKPCLAFNTSACEDRFVHQQHGSKGHDAHMCIHICAICISGTNA